MVDHSGTGCVVKGEMGDVDGFLKWQYGRPSIFLGIWRPGGVKLLDGHNA